MKERDRALPSHSSLILQSTKVNRKIMNKAEVMAELSTGFHDGKGNTFISHDKF